MKKKRTQARGLAFRTISTAPPSLSLQNLVTLEKKNLKFPVSVSLSSLSLFLCFCFSTGGLFCSVLVLFMLFPSLSLLLARLLLFLTKSFTGTCVSSAVVFHFLLSQRKWERRGGKNGSENLGFLQFNLINRERESEERGMGGDRWTMGKERSRERWKDKRGK